MTPNYSELANTTDGKLFLQLLDKLVDETKAADRVKRGDEPPALVKQYEDEAQIARENVVNFFFYRFALQRATERKLRDTATHVQAAIRALQGVATEL